MSLFHSSTKYFVSSFGDVHISLPFEIAIKHPVTIPCFFLDQLVQMAKQMKILGSKQQQQQKKNPETNRETYTQGSMHTNLKIGTYCGYSGKEHCLENSSCVFSSLPALEEVWHLWETNQRRNWLCSADRKPEESLTVMGIIYFDLQCDLVKIHSVLHLLSGNLSKGNWNYWTILKQAAHKSHRSFCWVVHRKTKNNRPFGEKNGVIFVEL